MHGFNIEPNTNSDPHTCMSVRGPHQEIETLDMRSAYSAYRKALSRLSCAAGQDEGKERSEAIHRAVLDVEQLSSQRQQLDRLVREITKESGLQYSEDEMEDAYAYRRYFLSSRFEYTAVVKLKPLEGEEASRIIAALFCQTMQTLSLIHI